MRPRISAVLAAVLTLVVASGCGDDESPTSPPPPAETGSILVNVIDYNGTIVPGATVGRACRTRIRRRAAIEQPGHERRRPHA